MKIVILDGYTENPGDLSWEGLKKLGELTVYDRTPAEEVIERIGDAEIVYTNKTPITKETLDACKNIRFIGVLATGFNIVDVQAAKEKNIPVTNVPCYGTDAVAQYTMALLLEICHNVRRHSDAVHEGRWTTGKDFCFWDYPLIELKGKTLGIIGYGRIGRRVAELAKAFGMDVLAYIRTQKASDGLAEYVSLDELYAESDVITLHCPLTNATNGMICSESIKKMKDGVILINTGRGPLLKEQDVCDALESGKVAAAALDVVTVEPIKADNPLLSAPNCIITPHIAWAPKEARQRLMDVTVENLTQFLAGNPVNIVNK